MSGGVLENHRFVHAQCIGIVGLAWVMFRDREDFIDSFVRIFSSEYTYFVPTRALLYLALAVSLLASEYHVLF